MSKTKFILSDESINVYGYRILTKGIDLTDFLKNPVGFYNHNRWDMPICKWEVEVKGTQLIGNPIFDTKDELAAKVSNKIDEGILNATSISIDIIEMSEDPLVLVQGQTRATVTKCKLKEISIVDIPGNRNAVRLNFPEKGISLDGSADSDLLEKLIPTISLSMKKIFLSLGLDENATEDQAVAAIAKLQAERITSLMDRGAQKGVINDTNKAHYEKLAATNFDVVAALVDAAPKVEAAAAPEAKPETKRQEKTASITAALKDNAGAEVADDNDRTKWKLNDWRKKDPKGLQEMTLKNPEQYNKLLDEFKKSFNS